jgi:hypothetical protein
VQNERTDIMTEPVLAAGTPVEVRRRFDFSWARGFEVAEVCHDGYTRRRKSDGSVLPAVFEFADVRLERRRPNTMWWSR